MMLNPWNARPPVLLRRRLATEPVSAAIEILRELPWPVRTRAPAGAAHLAATLEDLRREAEVLETWPDRLTRTRIRAAFLGRLRTARTETCALSIFVVLLGLDAAGLERVVTQLDLAERRA